jgi:hypothetical protein
MRTYVFVKLEFFFFLWGERSELHHSGDVIHKLTSVLLLVKVGRAFF